ncbi:MAG TPA: radical SAM protein [Clostridia bacterium]|nr:radical SAM protein [Clostridia bacterium]
MRELEELYQQSWPELQRQAWTVRRSHHEPKVVFAVPGPKRYEGRYYTNREDAFVQISVTGTACALKCAHCNSHLLKSMLPVESELDLISLGQRLLEVGTKGVLISGGADSHGRVPLKDFLSGIEYLKQIGLKVIVHSGLIDPETAAGLKKAGVDQVLLDVIGDERTIREVYHLAKTPEDYRRSLYVLREVGLPVVPHIVAGLYFGNWEGELDALAAVTSCRPEAVVIVVLNPLPGTEMAGVVPPFPEAVGKLVAAARVANPTIPLMFGCAVPPRPAKDLYQEAALMAGVNGVAYPTDTIVEKAQQLGLDTWFSELCCSLSWP